MTTIIELGLQLHHILVPAAFLGLSLLAILLGLIGVWASNYSAYSDGEGWGITAFGAAFVAAFVGIFWFFAAIPFDGKYYPLYSVSGTVETISNGFVDGSGDSTFLSYVVTLEGDERPYLIDDPRITTLDGQEIELLCTIGWVYQGADKWTCDIRDGGY